MMLEVANALWKQNVLFKRLRSQESTAIFHDFVTLPLKFYSAEQLASEALQLAMKHQHSVYDMLYCALAIEHDCEFVTVDKVLVNKLQKSLSFVRYLPTLPI